jgi:hypothetical protein
VVSTRIPQPWTISTSSDKYISWKVNTKAGHTGGGSIRAVYSKAPADGKSQTASIKIPMITPAKDDLLFFAMRSSSVGSSTCGADDFEVLVDGKVVYKRCNAQAKWGVQEVALSTWDGKTVDIEFRIVTGKDGKSSGTFELDDIAILGKCTYACFYETFDTTGIKGWAAASNDVKNLKWALGTDKYKSKPNSAYITHDDKAATGKQAALVGKISAGSMFMVPLTGATYEYSGNVFMKVALCSATPEGEDVSPVALSLQTQEQMVVINPNEDPGEVAWTLNAHCDSTTGWQVLKGDVPAEANGQQVTPAFEVRKEAKEPLIKAYFDDLKIICK